MLGNLFHGLVAVPRLQDGRVASHLLEDAAQSISNQVVIIDDENFHEDIAGRPSATIPQSLDRSTPALQGVQPSARSSNDEAFSHCGHRSLDAIGSTSARFTKIRARGNEVPAQLMKGYYDGEPSFRSNRGDHARYGAMNGLTFVEWAGQFLVLTLKRRDRCPRLHSASSSDFVALLTKAIHRSQD